MVLWLPELHISRSLKRRIRAGSFRVTADTSFRQVMTACAEARRGGTWITDDMIAAYTALHHRGHAHSIESWEGERLVGGVYGVSLGRMFFGESMFARSSDASKVAFAHLVYQLGRWDFELIDCQMATAHLASLGAREIPRADFLARVDLLTRQPPVPSPWRLDTDLAESF